MPIPDIKPTDFLVESIDDEVRADRLCGELLMEFYRELQTDGGDPEVATGLARSADYFTRDFLIGAQQWYLFDETRSPVRPFAGTWYIITTLEPSIAELTGHLAGILSFYRYLARHGLISSSFLATVDAECSDHAYYEQRIRSFWEITGDGYREWERSCPVKRSSAPGVPLTA